MDVWNETGCVGRASVPPNVGATYGVKQPRALLTKLIDQLIDRCNMRQAQVLLKHPDVRGIRTRLRLGSLRNEIVDELANAAPELSHTLS